MDERLPYEFRWLGEFSEEEILESVRDDVAIMIGAVGVVNTIRLLNSMSRNHVYVPTPRMAFKKLRNRLIRRQSSSQTTGQATTQFMVGRHTVSRAKREGDDDVR